MEGMGVLLPQEQQEDDAEPRYRRNRRRLERSASEAALLTPAPGDRYLDIRYDSDGTLGLQFHAESDPPFAVARITPGSLTAAQPLALAGMVLVAIAGAEVGPESEYAAVLDMLRRSGRPLELRFRMPELVEDEEEDHPDGPVEYEGVLHKLERDTRLHTGYVPHSRFFVLRADGLEYFRLFLAGAFGGDTVTSGAGRSLPFSDVQAVVPGTDLPASLIGASPAADRPAAAGGGAEGPDDPFSETFSLSFTAEDGAGTVDLQMRGRSASQESQARILASSLHRHPRSFVG